MKEEDTVQTFEDAPVVRDARLERVLVCKLDMRMLPTVFLIFIMNYIDVGVAFIQRLAITTARLKGLEDDLGLTAGGGTDLEYSVILSVLYATYFPAQIPSNMALNYITRPSLYIGGCVVFWGLISALTGVTHSFRGILACRLFLGIPEAAFYPGTMYMLSRWYTKKELAFRSAILYSGLLISNAFGSSIAAGILGEMEGKRGIRAWRWLFYIEGSITICIGLLSMWLLPDYPHNTHWMSPGEQSLAQARIAEDAGEADKDNKEDTPLHGLKLALKDPLVYVFSIMNIAQLLGLSFSNFFPTLTETLGFSTTVSLLLCVADSRLQTAVGVFCNYRTGERFLHISGWWWVVIVGFIIALSTMHTGARYASLFLMACGYTGFALTLVWVSNVIVRPPAKRAAAMDIVNGVGSLGFLIGSYTWKTAWRPEYHQSMAISLAALIFSTVLSIGIRQSLIRENKRLDNEDTGKIDERNDPAQPAPVLKEEQVDVKPALELQQENKTAEKEKEEPAGSVQGRIAMFKHARNDVQWTMDDRRSLSEEG
ncbi:major facilitator superfamily domain-containing protein [Desarmillaria tabescens]|uniref:Major facilitator superfamily domain-containing protein n=1 Tax=Armillaria tabescens TaxID=1929756 RepID=A0AA39NQ92_ARMTA|nr:major facilitator superfamily domain-containing protein [Desarmillaria tabescens]KAK0469862.1 major facilitator superfamily domain-containing protein [Desarmillaria tabescens]